MHILVISRCPPYPLHLGDRLILYHLARELTQRGHTLDLLAFDDRPDLPDDRAQYAPYFRSIEIMPTPRRSAASLLRRILWPRSRFPAHADDAWSPLMWRAVERSLAHSTYDGVQVFGGVQVYEVAPLIAELPAVITPYESYALYLQRQIEQGGALLALRIQHRAAIAYERFMFTPYNRTVVVAERDREALLDAAPDLRVEVIPNGIDLTHFPPPNDITREPNLLLFSGNFEYAPNVDAALRLVRDILPRLLERIPDAVLVLAGSSPPPELQVLAGDRVQVTGYVPDTRAWLARASVYISPLMLGAGIKNKILEAMASGVPVVATPISMDGIAARDGHEALIRPVETLAQAAAVLLNDPALRSQLALNARRLIESRYTWGAAAEAYEKLYTAITMEK